MRGVQRLRDRRDFARVYARGKPFRNELLVLRALPSGRGSRFGFTANKTLGTAVVRNRIKRRLREAARSLGCAEGWDVVVNARPGAATASYDQLHIAMSNLMNRAGVEFEEQA